MVDMLYPPGPAGSVAEAELVSVADRAGEPRQVRPRLHAGDGAPLGLEFPAKRRADRPTGVHFPPAPASPTPSRVNLPDRRALSPRRLSRPRDASRTKRTAMFDDKKPRDTPGSRASAGRCALWRRASAVCR